MGDLFSGRIHHDAEAIDPSSRSLSCSMLHRWALLLGSKLPLQGTNRKIMGNVRGRMHAFGLISASRKAFLLHMLIKFSLEAADLNSSSIAGLSKMETLRIARDGGGGSSPSGVIVQLSIQSLNV